MGWDHTKITFFHCPQLLNRGYLAAPDDKPCLNNLTTVDIVLVAGRNENDPLSCLLAATSRDAVCQSPVSINLQNASISWSNRKKNSDWAEWVRGRSSKVKVLALPFPTMLKCLNWRFDRQKFYPFPAPSRRAPALRLELDWVKGGSVLYSWQDGCHHITTTTTTTITKSINLLRTYLLVDFMLRANFTHKIHFPSHSALQSQVWHLSSSLRSHQQQCLQNHHHHYYHHQLHHHSADRHSWQTE